MMMDEFCISQRDEKNHKSSENEKGRREKRYTK